MKNLFISDLHLTESRPGINRLFFDFLAGPALKSESLFVLGDLFEYWAGDDDLEDPFNYSIAEAFYKLSQVNVTVYIMHGNRDFLIGKKFITACNAHLLPDPTLMKIAGKDTLLMHGDTLCVDDVDYQKFRHRVRNPQWQQEFLSLPLTLRKEKIEALRLQSEQEKKKKSVTIMDVNSNKVADIFRQYNYPRLIHGHTHRPAYHQHQVDNRICERWVLTDWYKTGGYLSCDERECEAIKLKIRETNCGQG